MREIQAGIVINAKQTKVWDVLKNEERYLEWNPLIRILEGKISSGEKMKINTFLPGFLSMKLDVTVLEVIPSRIIRWISYVISPAIFNAEHVFEIKSDTDMTTEFLQKEIYNGLFSGLFIYIFRNKILQGFTSMNVGLKEKCETF